MITRTHLLIISALTFLSSGNVFAAANTSKTPHLDCVQRWYFKRIQNAINAPRDAEVVTNDLISALEKGALSAIREKTIKGATTVKQLEAFINEIQNPEYFQNGFVPYYQPCTDKQKREEFDFYIQKNRDAISALNKALQQAQQYGVDNSFIQQALDAAGNAALLEHADAEKGLAFLKTHMAQEEEKKLLILKPYVK